MEWTPQERALKGSDDDNFLFVCRHFCKLNNVDEELALVNADHIKFTPFIFQITKQASRRDCLLLDATVSGNTEVITIASVRRELNLQYFFACDFMFSASSKQFGTLASKHAPHNQFNATTLLQSVQ